MTVPEADRQMFVAGAQRTPCRHLSMRNSTFEGNNIEGVFSLSHVTFNSRPVYLHTPLNLFLYFFTDSSLSVWVVGPKLGARAGVMYAYDVGIDPASLSGSWSCLNRKTWIVDPDVSFVCLS